jgi:hypothetical protein
MQLQLDSDLRDDDREVSRDYRVLSKITGAGMCPAPPFERTQSSPRRQTRLYGYSRIQLLTSFFNESTIDVKSPMWRRGKRFPRAHLP